MHPLRYGVLTGGALLAVCALVGSLCLAGLVEARARTSGLSARTIGEIVAATPSLSGGVAVRWVPAGAAERTDALALTTDGFAAGTRVEIAYDPQDPERLVVPGSVVLADGDRAGAGLAFVLVVVGATVLVVAWQLASRTHALRRAASPVTARPFRVQSGLLTRAWFELDDGGFIAVHPDPVLARLPSPSTVTLLGDPVRHRLVGVVADGVTLAPSGGTRRTQPSGRRLDNPSRVDTSRAVLAADRYRLLRRLRVDAVQAVPAPVVGVVWVIVLGGGIGSFLAATAITAAAGLFRAAVHGSDPSG
ncbi:MAG: hypothetical protein ACR2GH_15495 [Pseudonocardia sp.]